MTSTGWAASELVAQPVTLTHFDTNPQGTPRSGNTLQPEQESRSPTQVVLRGSRYPDSRRTHPPSPRSQAANLHRDLDDSFSTLSSVSAVTRRSRTSQQQTLRPSTRTHERGHPNVMPLPCCPLRDCHFLEAGRLSRPRQLTPQCGRSSGTGPSASSVMTGQSEPAPGSHR